MLSTLKAELTQMEHEKEAIFAEKMELEIRVGTLDLEVCGLEEHLQEKSEVETRLNTQVYWSVSLFS